MERPLKTALINFVLNTAYSLYYLIFGFTDNSWWLLTLGLYYFILSVVRFVVLQTKSKERFVLKFAGIMLVMLSIPLVGTVILSIARDRGKRGHMIVMIAIAAYAFTKITLATIKFIKSRHGAMGAIVALRNISFADAFVSIFALQRSMLVSFEGMSETEIVIMNASLGSAVCVIVFLLGINLLQRKSINNI